MAITQIDTVSIPVSDQAKSKAFYSDVLGFEVVADFETGPKTRWIQLRPQGAQTTIALIAKEQTLPGGMQAGEPGSAQGMTLLCDDIDGMLLTLSAEGVDATKQTAPWGAFAVFKDPDGNAWVLRQSA